MPEPYTLHQVRRVLKFVFENVQLLQERLTEGETLLAKSGKEAGSLAKRTR